MALLACGAQSLAAEPLHDAWGDKTHLARSYGQLATISQAARSITEAKGQAQLRAGEAVFPDRAHQPSRTRRSCPPSVPNYSTLGRLETTPGLYPRRYRTPPAYAVGRFAPFLLLGGRPRGRRCSGCWRQDTPARGPPGRHARRASRHHHRLLDTTSGCSMSGEDRAWRSRNSKAKESKDTDMDHATESYGHPMCGTCVDKRGEETSNTGWRVRPRASHHEPIPS